MEVTVKQKPEKVDKEELTAAIKAVYEHAEVEIVPDKYEIKPDAQGNYGEGTAIPGGITVKLDGEIDKGVVEQIIAAHRPTNTDAEKLKIIESQRLFDLLMLDPRMKTIAEVVG